MIPLAYPWHTLGIPLAYPWHTLGIPLTIPLKSVLIPFKIVPDTLENTLGIPFNIY
jgi:hypothetical protein